MNPESTPPERILDGGAAPLAPLAPRAAWRPRRPSQGSACPSRRTDLRRWAWCLGARRDAPASATAPRPPRPRAACPLRRKAGAPGNAGHPPSVSCAAWVARAAQEDHVDIEVGEALPSLGHGGTSRGIRGRPRGPGAHTLTYMHTGKGADQAAPAGAATPPTLANRGFASRERRPSRGGGGWLARPGPCPRIEGST